VNNFVFFLFFTAVIALPQYSAAQSLSDLDRAQAELTAQENMRANRAAERKRAEAELQSVKKQLVKTAGQSQKIEDELFRLQNEQADLKARQSVLVEDLLENQGLSASVFRQIYAAQNVPVYGMYYTDKPKRDVILRDIALSRTLPQLGVQNKKLQAEVEEIKTLQAEIQTLIRQQNEKITDLQSNSVELKRLADKRQKLFRSADADYQANLKEIERLRRESNSLQELIANIKPSFRPDDLKPVVKKPEISPVAMPPPTPEQTSGNNSIFTPVAGNVKIDYGQTDEIGAKSNGIVFNTQPKAVVVTPKSGKVAFAGPFQHYKNLLILEHSDGYHSLIAGLDIIDVAVGATLDSGEPVGRIDRSNNKNGRLYYGVRKSGTIIKPYGFLNIKNG